MSGYIKYKRGYQTDELQRKYPNAFLLLAQIARRARRTNEPNAEGLSIGEAEIGDYKLAGIKKEQPYRTAKKILERLGLVTFRGTNKGTIAKLISTDIYDINAEPTNEQVNEQTTDNERTDV
ncbi:MAG: hypothetical protein ABFD79_04175 [Phycisphaerales bacterium]